MTNALEAGALDGVRVIDFTNFIAGPVVTRFLADMGAEVIKVELPPRGDQTAPRFSLESHGAAYTGIAFAMWNRGKKSVCLDFHKPEGLRDHQGTGAARRRGGREFQPRGDGTRRAQL